MKAHSNIPALGILVIFVIALTFMQTACCQSIVDRIAYQTGIGAASRARVNGMLPSSGFYARDSRAYWQDEPWHFRTNRAFTRIRIKKLHRIVTRIKLDRIKIKIKF